MSFQTISTDLWELRVPEDWIYKDRGIEGTTYFEAPDGHEGIYRSTWRDTTQPLLKAMLDARTAEQRNLPTAGDGEWELLQTTETEGEANTEVRSEYFNRDAAYRIVSRLLGRADHYVRLSYHDYACTDLRVSTERSEIWIGPLRLRDGNWE